MLSRLHCKWGGVVDILLYRDRQGQIAEVSLLSVPSRLPPSAISLERHEARYRMLTKGIGRYGALVDDDE